ncbi:MAG: O-antigen ligase family protein [Thermodesulfobacteriota bacterium]
MLSPDHIRLALTATALLLTAGILFRPFYGVIGYLIIMVVRPGVYYPALGSIRIELIVGLINIAVMLFSPGRLQRGSPKQSGITKSMLILYGIMLVSMIQAFNFSHSYDWMKEFTKVLVFFMMIVTLSETERDLETLLWVFGILTAYLAYQAIYNFHTGFIVKSISDQRIDYATTGDGMGAGHVALANLILQGMPFLWYLSIANTNRLLRTVGFGLLVLCLYGVIISGSRGGFVGLVVFYLCLLYFSKKRIVVGIAGVAGAFLLPLVAGENYLNYMDTILGLFTGSAGVSESSRITGLKHGFEMLLQRPLLGVGPGCYPLARKAWFGWGLWAHNHYGELMGDLGIIGTIAWFALFKNYFMKAWPVVKERSPDPSLNSIYPAIVVSSIVRLVVGMGTHSVYIFFWYMIAAVIAASSRIRTESGKEKAMSLPDKGPKASRIKPHGGSARETKQR